MYSEKIKYMQKKFSVKIVMMSSNHSRNSKSNYEKFISFF